MQTLHNISLPNDGLGDALRDAFHNQNEMNSELYENKVDKENGKGLSSNDFTTDLKNKLEGMEESAMQNVQPDWNQTDNTEYDYIKNKPSLAQFASVIGFFDYRDSATQTTPIALPASTDTALTNDGAATDSNYENKPFGVDDVLNTSTGEFDFSQLSPGDLVALKVDTTVTTTNSNQTVKTFLVLGQGSPTEQVRNINTMNVKNAGENENSAVYIFYITEDIRDNPGKLYLNTDHSGSVKVDSFLLQVIRRNVNITTIEGSGSGAATWGGITGDITLQTDLIAFLASNYYPSASNPAGYLTSLAWGGISGTVGDQTDLIAFLASNYYPLGSNPNGYLTETNWTIYRQVHENMPVFNSATLNNVQGVIYTASGATARSFSSISTFDRFQRMGIVASTTGNAAQLRQTQLIFTRNSGFDVTFRFGMVENSTGSDIRFYGGVCSNTGVFGNVEANTLLNTVGLARLTTSNNLHIIHNDNSGTATTIDLGTNFPINTISSDIYSCRIRNSGSSIIVYVERIGTAFNHTQTITTDIPTLTQGLNTGFYIVQSTGLSTATGFDFMGCKILV